MDPVNQKRIDQLHPKIRQKVTDALNEANSKLTGNAQVRIVQGLRTIAEQDALYAQGRTTKGPIVTKAKGGSSFHNYGLAIDFALLIDSKEISWNDKKDYDVDKEPDWMEVVKVFKAHGFEWGGDWKTILDKPHFQMTFGNKWQTLFKKYQNKDTFIDKNGTTYVNI